MGWGCLGCSAGLSAEKGEGPEPVLPMPGKVNIGFVVGVPVVGVGWVIGIENVGAGVAIVVDGGGTAGLEKKLGTAVLVVVTEGSGFVAGAGVVVGLAKKFGIAGCTGAGTAVEGVGTGVDVVNKFFAGSLVSVVGVLLVTGFGCVGAAEAGVVKL